MPENIRSLPPHLAEMIAYVIKQIPDRKEWTPEESEALMARVRELLKDD